MILKPRNGASLHFEVVWTSGLLSNFRPIFTFHLAWHAAAYKSRKGIIIVMLPHVHNLFKHKLSLGSGGPASLSTPNSKTSIMLYPLAVYMCLAASIFGHVVLANVPVYEVFDFIMRAHDGSGCSAQDFNVIFNQWDQIQDVTNVVVNSLTWHNWWEIDSEVHLLAQNLYGYLSEIDREMPALSTNKFAS